MNGWDKVAAHLHARVRANCWDSLAGQLLILHQPHIEDEQPVCQGCDRDERGTSDPVWPCRTYTLIASTLLSVTETDDMLTPFLKRAAAMRALPSDRRSAGPPMRPLLTRAAPAEARTGHPRSPREKT